MSGTILAIFATISAVSLYLRAQDEPSVARLWNERAIHGIDP